VSYGDYGTGCKIQVSDPSRDMRFFSSLKCPDRLWDHPASYSKEYMDSSLGVKWLGHGVDHCFPFGGQG